MIDAQEVIRAYQSGEKPTAIAKRMGISKTCVFSKLVGVPRIHRVGNRLKKQREYRVWLDLRKRVFRDIRAPGLFFDDYAHFLAHMGPCNGRYLVHPRGADYGPATCRWGTLSEARSRSFAIDTAPEVSKQHTHP